MGRGIVISAGYLALLVAGLTSAQTDVHYKLDKNFSELTPAEQTTAKEAALHEAIRPLVACANPANPPLSDRNGHAIDNQVVKVLADARHTAVSFC